MVKGKKRKGFDPNSQKKLAKTNSAKFLKEYEKESLSTLNLSQKETDKNVVMTLLEESQKITLAEIMSVEKIKALPSRIQLYSLNEIFFEVLGRGIFSLTKGKSPAYVPLDNLRSTQSQTISLVKKYEPLTQFCVQSRLHPDDPKFGAIVVFQKDSPEGLSFIEFTK